MLNRIYPHRKKFALTGILLGAGFIFGVHSNPIESAEHLQASSSAPRNTEAPSIGRARDSAKVNLSWSDFQARFGEDLEAEFLADGTLVTIRGHVGRGRGAEGRFQSSDQERAVARAKEIIAAASHLLGIDPSHPLGDPSWKGDFRSAQVFFRETYQGIPVEPGANVSIDLGPTGELIGLYSNYVPHLNVEEKGAIPLSEAQGRAALAMAHFPGASPSSEKVQGGSEVVWISEVRDGVAHGSMAYEFMIKGYRVLIDAATGRVLSHKNTSID